ncbi:MAG: hypothetical protein EOL91_10155 [Actinobacteria bacterium]|nr:hypothetical protein [Actinomycetota bacterium]
MALKYPQYQVRDGVTPLSQRVLNPIFRDLDARMDVLEGVRADWASAVAQLQAFGLSRLDESIAPLLAQLQSAAAEVIAAIQDAGEILTRADLAWLEEGSAALTYDAEGRIATLTETLDGGATRVRVHAYVEDRLASVTTTLGDQVRRTTYHYTGARLTGWTQEVLS